MGAICISYRPDDGDDEARGLHVELVQRFGEAAVRLVAASTGSEAMLASCSVLLTVIGRRWLYAANEKGQRWLDEPRDGVRRAALAALQRDVPLVAVLVQGARMPHAAQLPAELAELAFQNAVELTRTRWSSDVSVLARVLSRHVAMASSCEGAAEPVAPESRRRWRAPLVMALALVLLAIGGLTYAVRLGADGTRGDEPTGLQPPRAQPLLVQHGTMRRAHDATRVYQPTGRRRWPALAPRAFTCVGCGRFSGGSSSALEPSGSDPP